MQHIDSNQFGPWAIVTGASSGIGAEFARQLAASGLNLVLVARREPLLDSLADTLTEQYGVDIRTVPLDLTRPDFLSVLQAETTDLEVGLLISNAGSGNPGAFLAHDLADLGRVVDLNVRVHQQLVHTYGRKMVARGKGGVLLVSAMGSSDGLPYMANDAATKAYINSLGEALNVEWASSGVHVTVLQPGPTETPILDQLGFDRDSMPVKPMPVDACVAEGLAALQANKANIISGRLNRLMAALVPASVSRKMLGNMIAGGAEKHGKLALP